jgi:hypothetical protein
MDHQHVVFAILICVIVLPSTGKKIVGIAGYLPVGSCGKQKNSIFDSFLKVTGPAVKNIDTLCGLLVRHF